MSRESMRSRKGIPSSAFEPRPIADRVTALEAEIATLKSFVNSLGKTELQGEGTAANPFVLTIGMELVPNAFYSYDGGLYVYMGTAQKWDGSAVDEAHLFASWI